MCSVFLFMEDIQPMQIPHSFEFCYISILVQHLNQIVITKLTNGIPKAQSFGLWFWWFFFLFCTLNCSVFTPFCSMGFAFDNILEKYL